MKRFIVLLTFGVGVALPAARAHAQGFVVVVNAASPTAALSKSELSDAFLKKSNKLSPVDQERSAKVRDAFTKAVHGRAVAAINTYWQQQIFAGRDVPPPERGSDADVLAYVHSKPNAIGYVAEGTTLPAGVKAVAVR